MHAVLALQVAIGILTAFYLHSDALDAGFIAFLQVCHTHFVAV